MEGDSMWESIILCILIAAEFLLQYYYWLQRQSATTRQACGHYSSFIVGMTKAMKCSESLNSKMLGWVSMLINLATENRTEFRFIYHLKGLNQPSVMILSPQFLDRCQQSYRGDIFAKRWRKRYKLVLSFYAKKQKNNIQQLLRLEYCSKRHYTYNTDVITMHNIHAKTHHRLSFCQIISSNFGYLQLGEQDSQLYKIK